MKKKRLKVGDEIDIDVYGEGCCEICGEVVHNHIDCPVCNRKYVGLDSFHNLEEDNDEQIECGECGAVFKKISDSWYDDCRVRFLGHNPRTGEV